MILHFILVCIGVFLIGYLIHKLPEPPSRCAYEGGKPDGERPPRKGPLYDGGCICGQKPTTPKPGRR